MSIFDRVPRLKFCCFCVSLDMGSISIGIFFILLGFSSILIYFKSLYFINRTNKENQMSSKCGEGQKTFIAFLKFIVFIMEILMVVGGIALIYGIVKKKPLFIEIFMYFIVSCCIYTLLTEIYFLFFGAGCGEQSILSTVTVIIMTILLSFYFIIILNSYKISIED